MDQLQKTTDRAERQKLAREHQALMQTTMGMMSEMWGNGPMNCCSPVGSGGPHHRGGSMMGWNAVRKDYSNLTPAQLRERPCVTAVALVRGSSLIDQFSIQDRRLQ